MSDQVEMARAVPFGAEGVAPALPVSDAFSRLEHQVDRLRAEVGELERRLERVLAPDGPVDAKAPSVPASVPYRVSELVNDHADQVASVTHRVAQLVSRLEL